mmetsp:Transcript_51017/g.127931  ORF Transcript_51017/g.127931 Transcript_51017/m.127931 type:complete len:264 (+) Transcript_51017:2809-3600(+)
MVVLGHDFPLQLDVLLLVQLHHRLALHTLESESGARCVFHELDSPEGALTHSPHSCQVLELDVGVLQLDAVLQMLNHGPLHQLRKHRLAHQPQLHLRRPRRHRGRSRLVEEQRTLAKVVVLPACANVLAILGHGHLSAFDDVEGGSGLALLEDGVALGLLDRCEGVDELVQLLLAQVPEDVVLLHDGTLVVVLERAVDVAAQTLLQRGRGENGYLAGPLRVRAVLQGRLGLQHVLVAETLPARELQRCCLASFLDAHLPLEND